MGWSSLDRLLGHCGWRWGVSGGFERFRAPWAQRIVAGDWRNSNALASPNLVLDVLILVFSLRRLMPRRPGSSTWVQTKLSKTLCQNVNGTGSIMDIYKISDFTGYNIIVFSIEFFQPNIQYQCPYTLYHYL